MVTCVNCGTTLSGSFQLSNITTNYVYLGVTNGYFFASGAANYVYSYCLNCYNTALKNHADSTIKNLNTTLTQEKTNLTNQVNNLNNEKANLLNKIAGLETQLTSSKTEISALKSQITNLEALKESINVEKTKLANDLNKANTQISDLNIKLTNLNTNIATITNEKSVLNTNFLNSKKEIDQLNMELQKKSNEASNFTNSINNTNTKNTELMNVVTSLKNEKNALSNQLNSVSDSYKQVQEKLKSITVNENYDEKKAMSFYDVVIDIDSLKNLTNGWNISFSKEGETQLKEYLINSCVVGTIDFEVPHGYSIQTKGLSVKYPTNMKKSITLLDSAGFETPLKIFLNRTNNDELEVSKEEEELFAEIARDRQLTELFLQKFILEKSNILLIVVGILTYSDQKLLNRLKKFSKNKKLFIIHNLSNFQKKEQVDLYYEETLKKSFLLKTLQYISFKDNEQMDNEQNLNQNYFVEVSDKFDITHLIVCNDLSEAGDYYNTTTFNYLKQQITCYNKIKPFNLLEEIRNHLIDISKELMEEETRIKNVDDLIYADSKFSLKNPNQKIVLKRCLVDELGFSKFYGLSFSPNYGIYKDEKNKKLIIALDVPDLDKMTVLPTVIRGTNRIFIIKGTKSIKSENQNKNESMEIVENKRDIGNFAIEICLPYQEFDILNDVCKHNYDKGVLKILYDLKESYIESKEIEF